MAWFSIYDTRWQGWEVNWEGVTRIVRAYCRAQSLLEDSQLFCTPGEQTFFGKLPDTYFVEVDWAAVQYHTNAKSLKMLDDLNHISSLNILFNLLLDYRNQTRGYEAEFHKRQEEGMKRTSRNVEEAVALGERRIEIAKIVRDTSAGVVVAVATLPVAVTAAGAAATTEAAIAAAAARETAAHAGLLVIGAGQKAYAKFQDKHNIGSAILEAASTILVGRFEIGPLAKATEKAPFVFLFFKAKIDATFEIGKTLVEGGSAKDALKTAGKTIGFDLLTGGFGIMVGKAAMPALVKLRHLYEKSPAATKIGLNYAQDLAKDKIVEGPEPSEHRKSDSEGKKNVFKGDCLQILDWGGDIQFVESTAIRPISKTNSGLQYKSKRSINWN